MVFSSASAYLDLPHWQLQEEHMSHNHHQIIQQINTNNAAAIITTAAAKNPTAPASTAQPPHQIHNNNADIGSTTRPTTVPERARTANVPVPDPSLKCPRCDSTNTKFCYFNNYSLTQPRHFCKTCRRYWTRGGALRNVPVGGGCRRTRKPSSSSSSKSTSAKLAAAASNNSTAATTGSNYNQQRFLLSPLGHGVLVGNNADDHHLGFWNEEIRSPMMGGVGESNVVEPWARLRFDPGVDYGRVNNLVDDPLGAVKMEEIGNNFEISRQLVMNMGGGGFDDDDHHHHQWNNCNTNVIGNVSASCWNEISGFGSSPESNAALYLS